ncbi:MAG TPA: ABC transporter permease [Longimicrobiaceae bacterium]|nr:ABC transporter permease [Longimicrobiaceae bacterium]
MDTLLQDLRYALRTLRRSPGFAAVAVLTLALGIGANTAIFSVLQAVLLRPLPFADADRLMVFWNQYAGGGPQKGAISPSEFADYRRSLRAFESTAAVTDWNANLTGRGEPERVQGFIVSPNLFDVLGVRPALGRAFAPGEGVEGNREVAVLSHALWQRSFGADPAVVGTTVRLNGNTYTVVGVMPPEVRFPDAPGLLFPERADLWVPRAWESFADERGNQYLRVVGRLREGGTAEGAAAELRALAARFQAEYPESYPVASGWRPVAIPLREEYVGQVRPALLVLAGAVGLVLLIACANVANLLLARSAARRREIAVRSAVGAARGRLVRQLLTESLVLALAGAVAGVALASWGVAVLARVGPRSIPRLEETTVDLRVAGFALAASLLTAALFGLVPALQLARPAAAVLGAAGRASPDRGRRRLRSFLVAAQVALAVVVLVGAGLLLRSFARLQGTDPGFDPRGVLTFQVSLPPLRYDSLDQRVAVWDEVLGRVAALPGVRAAGGVNPLPLSGDAWSASFMVEGQPVPPGGEYPHAEYAAVSPDYFRAMGISLHAGRAFTGADRAGAPAVAVVDERLARRYWPGEDPVGKRLSLAGQPDTVFTEVVGVVEHVRAVGLHQEGEPQVYVPLLQRSNRSAYMAVSAPRGDPLRLAAAIRAEVRRADPELPIAKVATMEQVLARATADRQFSLVVLAVFAAAALLLAAVGIYGVASYLVAQRTREIGIRMALGARGADVLRLVAGEGLAVVAAGIVAGTVGALAFARLLSGLLYGLTATDPLTYLGVALLLGAVATAALLLPARRASRVDPVVALRAE